MSPTADVIYMGNGIHVGLKRVKPTVRGNPRLAPHTRQHRIRIYIAFYKC